MCKFRTALLIVILLVISAQIYSVETISHLSGLPESSNYNPGDQMADQRLLNNKLNKESSNLESANSTPQIVTLKINGSERENAFLVYLNDYKVCFKESDFSKLLSSKAIFSKEAKKNIVYDCFKNNIEGTKFSFDDSSGVLSFDVNPEWLASEGINLTPNNGVVFANPTLTSDTTLYQLFINQSVSSGNNNSNPAASVQNQFSTLYGSLVNIGGYSEQSGFIRNQSYWQTDFPQTMTSLIAGDTTNYPGTWGNSITYGGLHYGSNLNLQPFTVFSATPIIQGQASVPSTAQLLLNNQIPIGQTDVQPGPFAISNLPVINGNGTVTMQLKNNTGAVYQQVTVPFYASNNILKQGVYQYRYDAGLPNNNPGGWNMGYQESQTFFSTDHLYGLTNSYTVDLHSEVQPNNLYNIGLTNNFLIFDQLVANFTAAASTSESWGTGGLLGIGFNRQVTDNSNISYGYNLTLTSPEFQQLGIITKTGQDYPMQQTVFVNLPLTQSSSITFGANQQSQISYGTSSTYNSTFLWQITKSFNLNTTAMYTMQPNSSNILGFLANLNYIFANAASLQNSLQNTQQNGISTNVASSQYQYNDPTNTYGYNFGGNASTANAGNSQQPSSILGGGFYNFKNFNATAQSTFQDDQNYSFIGSVQGSAIISKEGFNLGRYSNLSFVLVSVNKIPNVSVLLNGTFIGKTDKDGYFLIPNVQSYLPQIVSIDANTLPINVIIEEYTQNVTTPLNAGIRVDFNPISYIPAMVKLRTPDGKPALSGFSAELYQHKGESDIYKEALVIVDDGLVQITQYSRNKDYFVAFTDKEGSYHCPLKELPNQKNPDYIIYMEDSICEKQL